MRRSTLILGLLLAFFAAVAFAVRVGEPAPNFTGTDSHGQTHNLSDYKGKFVVLEWHNQGCPYTKKHYESGNMEALQKEWTGKGVVWLTIISSAPGKQGYVTAAEENSYMKQVNATPTAAILDPTGKIGQLYSAKTTPHMYIIDPNGTLIYNGAIDDRPTSDQSDIKGSTNYVNQALSQATTGKPVTVSSTKPYGCSVKYAE